MTGCSTQTPIEDEIEAENESTTEEIINEAEETQVETEEKTNAETETPEEITETIEPEVETTKFIATSTNETIELCETENPEYDANTECQNVINEKYPSLSCSFTLGEKVDLPFGSCQDCHITCQEQKTTSKEPKFNSFTHRTYGYTVNFPDDWYWDGSSVSTLIISSEAITSNDEPLNFNNIKVVVYNPSEIDDPTLILTTFFSESEESDESARKFKAIRLKNHNHREIIQQIINSFELTE